MNHLLRNLLRDEEHASAILVWGCGAVCASCFLASLVAMAVLELQKQLATLAEQLQEMRANPPKRGFFD